MCGAAHPATNNRMRGPSAYRERCVLRHHADTPVVSGTQLEAALWGQTQLRISAVLSRFNAAVI